ncbi:hypothetical protein ADL22_28060 [Streptomyces sp. NRRL F-4489]|uniref:DUF2470 domain-containing protein n=1 Tax=Streptomyces sp. NRRL F-4489 TaxID=1609095 RepID=UPI00074A637D|nr:DUF2470 domain-containing protein [Streptomyces sp. NRRL F-4489]KUL35174.1 hypothetical protein ADL22_28060 [Streptomyces sp. NRRL F-4489]
MASLEIPGVEDPDPLGLSAPVCRTVAPEGDVLMLLPGDSAAARAAAYAQDDDLPAVMEITDVAPVSVPHRVRGRAWVAGWLTPVRTEQRARAAMLLAERHPVGELLGIGEALAPDAGPDAGHQGRPAWALLRLEVGEGAVDDLWGAEPFEPDDFAAAAPDPLVAHEAELLQHLHSAHAEQVRGLCALLGERGGAVCGRRDQAVPLGLDRFGLRVRFVQGAGGGTRGGDGDGGRRVFDARFDFPEPVRDVAELRRALHALFDAAAS